MNKEDKKARSKYLSITDAETNKTYLSIREFSNVTGFNICTVYEKVNGGKIPKEAIVEIGKRKFIDKCFAKNKRSCSNERQRRSVHEIAKTAEDRHLKRLQQLYDKLAGNEFFSWNKPAFLSTQSDR